VHKHSRSVGVVAFSSSFFPSHATKSVCPSVVCCVAFASSSFHIEETCAVQVLAHINQFWSLIIRFKALQLGLKRSRGVCVCVTGRLRSCNMQQLWRRVSTASSWNSEYRTTWSLLCLILLVFLSQVAVRFCNALRLRNSPSVLLAWLVSLLLPPSSFFLKYWLASYP